jgi:hypothetical protein
MSITNGQHKTPEPHFNDPLIDFLIIKKVSQNFIFFARFFFSRANEKKNAIEQKTACTLRNTDGCASTEY